MKSGSLALSLIALAGIFFTVTQHLLNKPIDVSPLEAIRAETASAKKDENTPAVEQQLSQLKLSATIERPLFSRERKKFVPPPPPPPPKQIEIKPVAKLNQPTSTTISQPQLQAPKPNFTVIGVSLSDAQSSALVTGGAENRWVYLGERIDAWTVDAIDGDGILIRNGKQKLRLDLYTVYED